MGQTLSLYISAKTAHSRHSMRNNGEGGIRTRGAVTRTLVFETSSFSRSDTSPKPRPAASHPIYHNHPTHVKRIRHHPVRLETKPPHPLRPIKKTENEQRPRLHRGNRRPMRQRTHRRNSRRFPRPCTWTAMDLRPLRMLLRLPTHLPKPRRHRLPGTLPPLPTSSLHQNLP